MDWKNIVGKVAPAIGTALGGPFAGVAVNAIAKALGCSADDSGIASAMKNVTPDQLLALKQAEQSFAAKMRELDVQDMASARDREVKTGDRTTRDLAITYTLAYFAILIAIMAGWVKIPADMRDIFNGLLGVLSAAQMSIMSYYFGSSHGSAQKNELMARGGK